MSIKELAILLPIFIAVFIYSPVLLITILLTLSILFTAFYFHVTKNFDYWKKRGVSGPEPTFPYGTPWNLVQTGLLERNRLLYHYDKNEKYCGFFEFLRPVLMLKDPDLIKDVTIKDFDSFSTRSTVMIIEALRQSMVNVGGSKWKNMRSAINPTFSTAKLKAMNPLLTKVADKLVDYFDRTMTNTHEIEMKDVFGRYTIDAIATIAFGVECNSFKDPDCKFAKNANVLFRVAILREKALKARYGLQLGLAFPKLMPYLSHFFTEGRKAADFFVEIVMKTYNHRIETGFKRNDYFQLLLDASSNEGSSSENDKVFTIESNVGNSLVFFSTGYDTTATLLTFLSHCLATNPDVQLKVQEEIDAILEKHDNQLTYDALTEMTYLDQVINETLRLYPPGTRLERVCTAKEYKFPEFTIDKGTIIQIPLFQIQRNPKYYPDPLKFNPDRFSTDMKNNQHPGVYLPFGLGPKYCIGKRFALYESKVANVRILRTHSFMQCNKTSESPVPVDKTELILTPNNELWLKIKKREEKI